jgi:hypothetical protein
MTKEDALMGSPCAPDSHDDRPALLPAVPRGKRRRRPDVDPDLGMTLNRVGAARPHGKFDRPEGPFLLAEGLTWPGGLPLREAVERVAADWKRQLKEDKVAPVTVYHAEQNIRRFAAFAAGRGVRTLAEVTTQTCQAFCDARNARPQAALRRGPGCRRLSGRETAAEGRCGRSSSRARCSAWTTATRRRTSSSRAGPPSG